MPARVQQLVLGLGKAKQSAIGTVGASFLRFKKLDTTITSPNPVFEDDAAEIGKGTEFASSTFPSHYDIQNRIEKYASSEAVTWAFAYALGGVAQTGSSAPYTYTLVPIDPGTTLELPYFSVVEQIPEGGGAAIDNVYIGNAIEDVTYAFNYGPGRASSKITINWVGTGILTSPSAITVPATTVENNMLAGGMSLVINGVDYVANKNILSGTLTWKNNLLLNAGFYPGSGLQNGLQVRGRLEIGVRTVSFSFTVRLTHLSTEYALLTAQTAGTAIITVSHDVGNSAVFTFPQMAFKTVENTEADGIVAVTVTGTAEYNVSAGNPFNVVTKCGITGIAQ